jgi:hypothetical protein
MTISLVLHLVEEPLARGQLVGEVHLVSTGAVRRFRSADELDAAILELLSGPVTSGTVTSGTVTSPVPSPAPPGQVIG